jgi:hypothetical protein
MCRSEGSEEVAKLSKILYFVVVILLCFAQLSFAQTVTVRVINGKNQRPLVGQSVRVSLLYGKGEKVPALFDANLSLKTGVDGETKFSLPQPPPAHIYVNVLIDSSRWQCLCVLLDTTRNIVETGIVKTTTKKKQKDLAADKEGQILFIAQPIFFWYRLLTPLLRG